MNFLLITLYVLCSLHRYNKKSGGLFLHIEVRIAARFAVAVVERELVHEHVKVAKHPPRLHVHGEHGQRRALARNDHKGLVFLVQAAGDGLVNLIHGITSLLLWSYYIIGAVKSQVKNK